MTRAESKYFNTAAKMNEAFLRLLEQKDLAYITVKEICAAAGVNRSTFYLHYETIADLMGECVSRMNEHFLTHMEKDAQAFISKLHDCPLEELYLITPDYLTPYLRYVKAHQRLFHVALENASVLHLEDSYAGLTRYVLLPILERYGVPERDRKYILAFHIRGLMAIVTEWLKDGCTDPIDYIVTVIQQCVRLYNGTP